MEKRENTIHLSSSLHKQNHCQVRIYQNIIIFNISIIVWITLIPFLEIIERLFHKAQAKGKAKTSLLPWTDNPAAKETLPASFCARQL